MPKENRKPLTACIWCRVIDNFGDAGIAWRLARSLKREYNWNCHLIIDRLATLAAFVPAVDPSKDTQEVEGITVLNWTDAAAQKIAAHLPDVFIEAFSCFVPECCEAAIGEAFAQGRKIAVYDLDYLTAEDYASDNQGLPSPHPRFGYPKTFWFPGFTPASGGLLREHDLFAEQEEFAHTGGREKVLSSLGADPTAPFTLAFFTYPTNPIEAIAQAMAADSRPLQLLLCAGEASQNLKAALSRLTCPQIRTVDVPMLAQTDFDRLLWSVDAALVRGEDSTLRAQWAGEPLLWTLYPQDENTHLTKLAAFEKLYGKELTPAAALAWEQLEEEINNHQCSASSWQAWRSNYPQLSVGAQNWRRDLGSQTSLTQRLAQNAADQLK